METFEEIFKKHNGYMAHKWIHYFYIYDILFSRIREKNEAINMMEIGVSKGGSLEIWEKFLPKNSKITGIDINPMCSELKFSENISFLLGSASDYVFMTKNFNNSEFDVILDDGSHICSDVITTFEIMFPRLKNGGLYIIEDLHTSYWSAYGGGYRTQGSSIEYFKNLVESLNYYYAGENARSMGVFSALIESITFYDSICVIKKFSHPKIATFQHVITGQENIGNDMISFSQKLDTIEATKNIFGAK